MNESQQVIAPSELDKLSNKIFGMDAERLAYATRRLYRANPILETASDQRTKFFKISIAWEPLAP